jgi:glycerol-3-phosphate responsive antiterminator
MITELSEVRDALAAGAKGISTSAKQIWNERYETLTKNIDSV